ncbi:nuclear migration protein nudc [Anaeramoeba flamelloides]|uniref:Nuclear migration protein nudc n=1 Tax=Anaeramoeba flamelloides TaxID=1746091 RepID=A0ABQ8XJT4_9EUKA|nr:nuclear migration protein nudc [Anaeramoeba flamelloides]
MSQEKPKKKEIDEKTEKNKTEEEKKEEKKTEKKEVKKEEKENEKENEKEKEKEKEKEEEEKEKEEELPDPPYEWKQQPDTATVVLKIPEKIRGKNINYKLTVTHLTVGIKGEDPIIDGELWGKAEPEDSIWTLESVKGGKELTINLVKRGNGWWDSFIKGHKKMKQEDMVPDPISISDMDQESAREVNKMVFDMRQKQMGLPSSDELSKREKLQKQFPQFDFSQAKFN